ncbi:hypothetical protein SAMN04488005_0458 [Yoonia tamlensis]|uniref:Uncharacterized protein n=1 Tax=Yoonia tamlensis TaxID=390270 RepID=A0A1I6FTI1_9RHOB|nr:hypothetical protein [Yoonia tamlensis]SFR33233.1 hypothetical protein SAMN04488005_0458 [Yoonia tamlensis]
MSNMFKPKVPDTQAAAPPPLDTTPNRLVIAKDDVRKASARGKGKLRIDLNKPKTSSATGLQVPR